ncbi:hypothetical protein GTY67_13260 [Streptomyces sp. SID8374]|uniref:hypothetical protein n=1 Tax=Streptomyces sp. SID8374 TaxID=2690354 RepID=UPI0013713147|nr:hypothetical protein [Streptomyces sp. SID8374]MYX14365.1 hypothetical protein [Streptomyces sp. SID8374]
MRTRIAAAAAVFLACSLTACGEGGDPAAPKAEAQASASKKVDCSDESLGQAEWVENCAGDSEGAGTDGDGTDDAAPPTDETVHVLGDPVLTVGDEGAGVLEMTPTTLVFAKESDGNAPAKDIFVVVTVKKRPTTAAPAEESSPMGPGGWQWRAPDGQALDEGDGESYNVVLGDFNASGTIQPGSFVWDAEAFDLTAAQAKGGTLVYVDGEGTAHQWKMPAEDSGPQVAEVKRDLSTVG